MPIDDGFTLELDGQSLPIHGVWPNLIRTSTLPEDGIGGPLVYGGDSLSLDGNKSTAALYYLSMHLRIRVELSN